MKIQTMLKGYRCLQFCVNKYSIEISNLHTQKSQETFLQFLGPKSNITDLFIDSSITVLNTINFLPLLLGNMPLLENLVIDNRRKKIDPALLSETLQALLKVHKNLTYGSSIKLIRLRSLRIIKEAAIIISELLPILPELHTFEIMSCDYETDECMTIIANGIMNSKSLRKLAWTKIVTKDAKAQLALTNTIKLTPNLEILNFEYVRAPDKDFALRLSSAIKTSPTIQNLKLQLTTIPSECIKEFSDSLATNKIITSLVLNVRNLKDECNKDILTALRGNNKLRKLHLVSEEMCTEVTIQELASLLQTNRSIENLKIVLLGDYPSIGRMKEVLANNPALRIINIKTEIHPQIQVEPVNLTPILEGLRIGNRIEKAAFTILPSNEDAILKFKEFITNSTKLSKLKLIKAVNLSSEHEKIVGEGITSCKSLKVFTYKTYDIKNSLHNLKLEEADHFEKLKLDGHRSKLLPHPKQFTEIINANKSLKSIKLLQCNISNKSAIEIAKTIEKHPSLQRVNLHWIMCDISGILRLVESIKKNSKLRSINVRDSTAYAQLLSFVDVWQRDKKNFPGNNRTLSFEWMAILLSFISNDIKLRSKCDKKLIAFMNAYKYNVDGTRELLFPSKIEMQNITKINLNNSGLGPTQGFKIAKILSTCDKAEQILVMGNRFKEKGCVGISRMIPKLPKLNLLDISYNRISPKGIQHISNALKTNSTIVSLNIKGNYIYSHGAVQILNAIAINKASKIEFLDMGGCKIFNDIAKTFDDNSGLGKKIKVFGFVMNPITREFIKSLLEMYVKHKWTMKINVTLRNHEDLLKKIKENGLENLIKFIH